MVARLFRSSGRAAGPYHRRAAANFINLANDYGDAVKGSDKPDRIGPLRGCKGVITRQEMKRALIITVVLICISGLALVAVACHTLTDFIGFLILGGLSIIAAITYTVGNRPYGYIGLGDISVLVFFGWLSVMGAGISRRIR